MALMEILEKNKLNTTSMINVDAAGSTALAAYLFDRNPAVKYRTTDYNTNTTATIVITFSSPVVLSHVILQNHNLKQFQIYETTTSYLANVTQNSATSSYFSFASVTVSVITLKLDQAINGDEKQIGELILTERELQFERNPSIQNFAPKTYRKQIRHEMPDGGVSLFNIRDKYRANMGLSYITDTFHGNLMDIYNTAQPFIFCPFPTTTGWDGKAPEVVWSGDFDFKFAANAKEVGYTGKMILEETVSG